MKHAIKLVLVLAGICCVLTACAGRDVGQTTAATVPDPEPQEQVTEAVPFEELPEQTSPFIMNPKVPDETMPEKPDADYYLPPGEKPGGVPQVK